MLFGLLLVGMTAQAQTSRKFTLDLTDDGKAQMVCFLPETPSGKAIVGVPGGGYSVLSNEHEGYLASDWLNQQGIAYFVVNYRLPNGDRTLPMGDVWKGIRIVRDSAVVWGINPHDVGIMGFSAGGHLASVISTHSEFDLRPDFTILFYPVISMDERVSHKWSCVNFLGEEGQKNPDLVRDFSTMNAVRRHLTPPAIVITASDDRLVPFVTNGLEYYKAMRNAGNECTMHVYPTGDHGFGFGPWFKYHDLLLEDLGNWLKNLQAPKPGAIRVACIGNSITDGHGIEMASQYGYPALLQKALGDGYWVKNFGVSGRTMLAAEFKQDLEQMIKALGNAKIFLCTPIPAFKDSWNINDSIIVNGVIPIQKEVARQHGFKLIDLHTLMANDEELIQPDGIHPNEKGVAKMAEIIAAAIK